MQLCVPCVKQNVFCTNDAHETGSRRPLYRRVFSSNWERPAKIKESLLIPNGGYIPRLLTLDISSDRPSARLFDVWVQSATWLLTAGLNGVAHLAGKPLNWGNRVLKGRRSAGSSGVVTVSVTANGINELSRSRGDFLSGAGQSGALMRAFDWSATALGSAGHWPQSLRTSVRICLVSRLCWGPAYTVLYNDAYSAILGSKHPWALAKKCSECWAEIWGRCSTESWRLEKLPGPTICCSDWNVWPPRRVLFLLQSSPCGGGSHWRRVHGGGRNHRRVYRGAAP
jgi:hypothetical protein